MPTDITWPGEFLELVEKDKDGNMQTDEAKMYLLNSLLHEIVDQMANLNSVATADLQDGSVTEAKLHADLYTEATFTITGTGFTTSPTGSAAYTVLGQSIVVLHLPTITGTSNANTFTLTGVPAAIQPNRASKHFLLGTDNSSDTGVTVALANGSSTLTLTSGQTQVAWTGSGTKTIYNGTITYLL